MIYGRKTTRVHEVYRGEKHAEVRAKHGFERRVVFETEDETKAQALLEAHARKLAQAAGKRRSLRA